MKNNNITVHIHTLCHNEIERAPYAIKYWELCANHVFVYLMTSTNDGTREFLMKYPDFITIIDIVDDDGFNDDRNKILKNEVWKKSRGKADFVIVTDFDEFIYSPSFYEELSYMKENNQTIVAPEVYHLVTYKNILNKETPKDILLHEIVKNGRPDNDFGKHCIFNPNEVLEINYTPGAHCCEPIGNIRYYDREKIYLLHAKYLGIEWFINKQIYLKNRLSETNKFYGFGEHYTNDRKKLVTELKEYFDNSVLLEDIFK